MVRDLVEGDLDWVAEQERLIFGPGAWSRELIREDFAWGMRRYRGLECDGVLCAYAIYGFDGDAFHLMNVAVTPEYQGQGCGRTLMDDVVAEAGRLGERTVWLEVAVTNAAAIALYRGYGFTDVRVRKGYYQPGHIDAIVMRADLG
ncbi:MAG: ribosomal protein S18-alanine N-acetyltransferase [Demequina sp.]